jgi:hypothetical protein
MTDAQIYTVTDMLGPARGNRVGAKRWPRAEARAIDLCHQALSVFGSVAWLIAADFGAFERWMYGEAAGTGAEPVDGACAWRGDWGRHSQLFRGCRQLLRWPCGALRSPRRWHLG